MSSRIFIADAHPLVCLGLRSLLETRGGYQVVGQAAESRTAVQTCLETQPDLLIVDIDLPSAGAAEVIAQVRRRLPNQRALVLTSGAADKVALEVLRAGCLGCVKKDCPPDELMLAVQTVLSGQRFVGQHLADALLLGMLRGPGQRDLEPWDTLSSRERAVFKLIAQGGTNRSAALVLNLSAKTVEKHRANLMRKLRLNSSVELALMALDLGLIQKVGGLTRAGSGDRVSAAVAGN